MGCGTSANVVGSQDNPANGHKANGNGATNGFDGHNDDLPTVVLPETPIKPKPREFLAYLSARPRSRR